MNVKITLRYGLAALLAGALASCQTYNFEPVRPLAVAQTTQTTLVGASKLKPNIMVVVDQSGSMVKPIDPTNPNCPTACGTVGNPQCPGNCPTRISDLKDAMGTFFANTANQSLGRFGLDRLPYTANGQACGVAALANIDVNIPAPSSTDNIPALQQEAQQVNSVIQGISPGGGTPTAATLTTLQGYAPLLDPQRGNYVLLLTDGEPNCNANNPNNCTQAACNCTFYQGVAPTPGQCPGASCPCVNGSSTCELGCLDQDASVAAITGLDQKGIKTIPVGFGAETVVGGGGTGFAPVALNAMALAGGFARSCATDADCNQGTDGGLLADTCDIAGGAICPGGTYCCTRKYFVALNSSELQDALAKISAVIGNANPCHYTLDAVPQNPSLMVALMNGTDIPATGAVAGTCANGNGANWVYSPPSSAGPASVDFQGNCCTALTSPSSPISVEFRIVQTI